MGAGWRSRPARESIRAAGHVLEPAHRRRAGEPAVRPVRRLPEHAARQHW